MALSYAVRDRLMMRYLATTEAMRARPQKSVAYLSAEFLIGPQLHSNLLNLGIQKEAEEALKNFCLLYTSPSPRDATLSRMPSSA